MASYINDIKKRAAVRLLDKAKGYDPYGGDTVMPTTKRYDPYGGDTVMPTKKAATELNNPLTKVAPEGTVPIIGAPTLKAPDNLLTSKYGNISLDNGMPRLDIDIDANAKAYEALARSNAEAEAAAKMSAARNIYDTTLSSLNTQEAEINPAYEQAVRNVNDNSFNTSETAKELMNMYGWNPSNSGLAIGRLGAIDIQRDKDLADTDRKKVLALEDIANKRNLAKQMLGTSEIEAGKMKESLLRQASADALLKGQQSVREYYGDLRNYYKDNADMSIKESGVTGKFKGAKTAAQGMLDDEMAMKKDIAFTGNTGLTRMNDSMIDKTNPLRNSSDFAAVIQGLKSDPNWANDPKARYNVAAATYLRNQKINDMKDSNPEQYDKYKGTMNINDELMPAMPNVQWYRQFAAGEDQRDFTNNLATKQYDTGVDQWDKQFNTGVDQWGKEFNQKDSQFNAQLGESRASRLTSQALQSRGLDLQARRSDKPSAADLKKDLNQSFGEDYQELKNMSVSDASRNMSANADAFISSYGYEGFKDLWNSVMSDAIRQGQAMPMESSPKPPKGDTLEEELRKLGIKK